MALGRREAESHDHADHSADAASAEALPDVRPLLPADRAGDDPLSAKLRTQGREEDAMSATLPPLPASVLSLIERDHPDAVRRYRQDHGLLAPDERGSAPEQEDAQDVQTPTTTPERKRTRRSKP